MSLLNGLVVAGLAVALVVARVLWPKETWNRWREGRRFQHSVQEMLAGLDKLADERYDEALELFKLAAAQTPNKPAPVLLLIYVMGLQGQQREARQELRHALQRWPVETLPKRLLALAYLGAGQYDRAYASAGAAAAQEPVTDDALLTLGDICRLVERYPEAERAYHQALRLGAPHPYAGLAWVLATQGRVEEAEAELARAPARVLSLFEGQLALAQTHLQARRLEDALDVYQALLKTQRNVPRIVTPYALTLLEAGQIKEAYGVLSRAVAGSNEDPFAHCALAAVLVERNDLATAIVHVREALRLWPGYGNARGVYGDVLKRAGRYEAAEEQYREALRLNPFLADVHTRLAALLHARGQEDAAREHEREAHRLRPTGPRPITQEVLAITTETLALGTAPTPQARVGPRPETPADIDFELAPSRRKLANDRPTGSTPNGGMTPAGRKLPDLRQRGPDLPLPPQPATAAAPSLPGDIAVFPGASLVFDESRDNIFSQTLQVNVPPHDVLAFYHQRMSADGWQFIKQQRSAYDFIDGITLHYERGAQVAQITIGIPPVGRESQPSGDAITYIVTAVQRRQQSQQRTHA